MTYEFTVAYEVKMHAVIFHYSLFIILNRDCVVAEKICWVVSGGYFLPIISEDYPKAHARTHHIPYKVLENILRC